jgi:hypothetical protein
MRNPTRWLGLLYGCDGLAGRIEERDVSFFKGLQETDIWTAGFLWLRRLGGASRKGEHPAQDEDQRAKPDTSIPRSYCRIREGDRHAEKTLILRLYPGVYSLADRLVRNPETARDATQETFLRAFSKLDRYDGLHRFADKDKARKDLAEARNQASCRPAWSARPSQDRGCPLSCSP